MIRVLVLAVVLLSGCATSRIPASAPTTLADVNDALAGHPAFLILTDSTALSVLTVRDVQIDPSLTTFYNRQTRQPDVVATDNVVAAELRDHVSARNGTQIGAAIDAAPGLFIAGAGIEDAMDGEEYNLGPVFILIGSGFALIGGGAGAFIGSAVGRSVDEPESLVVYQGPVSRYPLPDASDT